MHAWLRAAFGLLAAAAWPVQLRAADAAGGGDAGLAAFVRHESIVAVRLSPGGTRVAVVLLEGGRRKLAVYDLAAHKGLSSFQPDGREGVGEIQWVRDDRLLVELVDHEGDLAQPISRGEIYSLPAAGPGGRMVFGYRAGEQQTGTHIRQADRDRAWGTVLGRFRGDPRRALVAARDWDAVGDRAVTLYRMDAESGLKDLLTRSPIREAWFLTDEAGEPRVACGGEGATLRLKCFTRDAGGSWAALELGDDRPLAFAGSGRTLYLAGPDGKGFGVFARSLDTGERTLLAHDDVAPPSGLVLDVAHRLVAVEFQPDLPRLEVVLPDHPFARVLAGLEPAFPGEHLRLVDRSDDDAKVVVQVFSDQDPGRFLVVDVKTMSAEQVGEVRPGIRPEEMAEVSAFHIPARDGLRLHGYVTLPPAPARPPFPMVVLPHGGPAARDTWGFDPEAQLLAHEGFAVLQVNFRGSEGYGDGYLKAGFGHWGDRMMEDLVDATRFAVRKGWADPARICAYGASFGGYAALQVAAVEPDLFRCAVGYAGVYDLERLLTGELVTSRQARAAIAAFVGEDAEAQRAASPAAHADRIRVPVLLIHGERDVRAPFAQAEAMRKALEKAGRPPEWLAEPREGHGFYDEGARLRMHTRLLEFLRANTGPRPAVGAAAP